MDTVTIRGVELVKVGRWFSRSHPKGRDYTEAELAAAVDAARDAEVDAAALKLGHSGALSELGDGAPAFGWVDKVRLSADRTTLLGDLVDVPAKLAAIMPKAFRRRSAELAFGVRTPSGKTYAMALTGLALLGATPPAVKGLADITSLYGLSGDPLPSDATDAIELATGLDLAGVGRLSAALDAVAELGLDGAEADAVVDRIIELAGVTEPTIPAADDGSRQNDAVPPAPSPKQETPTMDDAKLRKLLGIEENADIDKAVDEALAKAEADAETPEAKAIREAAEAKAAADAKALADAEAAKTPEPAGALSADTLAALKAAGLDVIPAGVLDELKAGAAAGTTAAAALAASERDDLLDAALRSGRIAPADVDRFRKLYDEAPETTKGLLSSLTPRFATAELGSAADLDADEITDEALAAFIGAPAPDAGAK